MRRTPAQLVETLREAHQQFLAALALIPDVSFHIRPREGEWSAADVLLFNHCPQSPGLARSPTSVPIHSLGTEQPEGCRVWSGEGKPIP